MQALYTVTQAMLACQRQGALGITGLQSTRQRLNDRCFVLEKRKNRTSSFFLYVCHVRQSIQGKIQKGKNDKQNEEVRFFHEGTLFFACQQGKKRLLFFASCPASQRQFDLKGNTTCTISLLTHFIWKFFFNIPPNHKNPAFLGRRAI